MYKQLIEQIAASPNYVKLTTTHVPSLIRLQIASPEAFGRIHSFDFTGCKDLNFAALAQLRRIPALSLKSCGIFDIDEIIVLATSNIQQLDLSDNNLISINGIQLFTTLQELNVANNRIAEVPTGLSLKRLVVSGNPVAKTVNDHTIVADLVSERASPSQYSSQQLMKLIKMEFNSQVELKTLLDQIQFRQEDYNVVASSAAFVQQMRYNSCWLQFAAKCEYSPDTLVFLARFDQINKIPASSLEHVRRLFASKGLTEMETVNILQTIISDCNPKEVLHELVKFCLVDFSFYDIITQFMTIYTHELLHEDTLAAFQLLFSAPIIKIADSSQQNQHLDIATMSFREVNLETLLRYLLIIISSTNIIQLLCANNQMYSSFMTFQVILKALGLLWRRGHTIICEIFMAILRQCNSMQMNQKQFIDYPNHFIMLNSTKKTLEGIKPKKLKESVDDSQLQLFGLCPIEIVEKLGILLNPATKSEILCCQENIDILDQYFTNLLNASDTKMDFSCALRVLLSQFLLAGEGQAVERAIQSVARTLSKFLSLDYKSTMITIGAILALNTQFICKRNGKNLHNFLYKVDFVEIVHTAPKFVQKDFPKDILERIFDEIEEKPLGVFAALDTIYFTSSKVIVDAELLSTELVQTISSVRASSFKQQKNYEPIDYFVAEKRRVKQELELMLLSKYNCLQNPLMDVVPVIIHSCFEIIQQSNIQQIILQSYKILKYMTNTLTQQQGDSMYHDKKLSVLHHLSVFLMSQTELMANQLLTSEEVFDWVQLQTGFFGQQRVLRHVGLSVHICKSLIQIDSYRGVEEFTNQILLQLSLIKSFGSMIENKTGSSVEADDTLKELSRSSAKQIISGAFWIISQIKKEVSLFDYQEFQNLLFRCVPLSETYEKQQLMKYQLTVKLSSFVQLSILIGLYQLLAVLVPHFSPTSVLELLPDIVTLCDQKLMYVSGDVKCYNKLEKHQQAPCKSVYDHQLKFAITMLSFIQPIVPQKEFDERFRQVIGPIQQLSGQCYVDSELLVPKLSVEQKAVFLTKKVTTSYAIQLLSKMDSEEFVKMANLKPLQALFVRLTGRQLDLQLLKQPQPQQTKQSQEPALSLQESQSQDIINSLASVSAINQQAQQEQEKPSLYNFFQSVPSLLDFDASFSQFLIEKLSTIQFQTAAIQLSQNRISLGTLSKFALIVAILKRNTAVVESLHQAVNVDEVVIFAEQMYPVLVEMGLEMDCLVGELIKKTDERQRTTEEFGKWRK